MSLADQTAHGHAWLDGAMDLHVHCAPSFFPRWGDGLDVARACEQAGMAGVLLKAHEGSTVESAAVLDRLVPTLRVFGGVVLNRYVGGINPAAAEAALRLGGRCVWFPTLDADAHPRAFGSTGAFPVQRGGIEPPSGQCIGIGYMLLPERFNLHLSTPRPVADEMHRFTAKLCEAIGEMQTVIAN